MADKRLTMRILPTAPPEIVVGITFQNPDRRDAKATIDRLDLDLQSSLPADIVMETLEPSTYPETPTAPRRDVIAFGGLVAGALAGLIMKGRSHSSASPVVA